MSTTRNKRRTIAIATAGTVAAGWHHRRCLLTVGERSPQALATFEGRATIG
ncbi:hypothetical protein P8605_02960 [Streptomyces sp. T-3]|nr:hypothetical protein [Streptomyces sp. T-3]